MTTPEDDFTKMLRTMFPAFMWTPDALDRAGRAQAAITAAALHKLNAPMEETLRARTEFAERLETAATQLGQLASQLQEMAAGYARLNRGLSAAIAPYLGYVEQLEAYGHGDSGSRASGNPVTGDSQPT
jgi:hypothetical protein